MLYQDTGYKVSDAMTRKPVAVSPEINLNECSKIMDKEHVGALIIKEKDSVLGIITEQDIVRKVVAKGVNPLEERVSGFMEKNVLTIAPEEDIFQALLKMKYENIRHLPVVSRNKMVGLLTLKDILKIQPQLFSLLLERFELKEEQSKPIRNPSSDEGICNTCGEYTQKLHEVEGSLVCEKCKEEN